MYLAVEGNLSSDSLSCWAKRFFAHVVGIVGYNTAIITRSSHPTFLLTAQSSLVRRGAACYGVDSHYDQETCAPGKAQSPAIGSGVLVASRAHRNEIA